METTERRSFYSREFTKKDFFNAVIELCEGQGEITDEVLDMITKAALYELDGLNNREGKSSKNTEKKDALQSDYANALREAIVPLVTEDAKTTKELIDAATAMGRVAPSGKPFSGPWCSRVLNMEPGIVSVKKIIETVNAKGLKSQKELVAYKRG